MSNGSGHCAKQVSRSEPIPAEGLEPDEDGLQSIPPTRLMHA